MILLLGLKNDAIVHSLHELLAEMDVEVVRLVPEELIFAKKWLHKIDKNGSITTEITLPNDKKIVGDDITGLFSRIGYLPVNHFADTTDRLYANAEFHALFVSFLKSLEAVAINPIQTPFLAADEENGWFYKMKASTLGIPVADEQFTSSPKWDNSPSLNVFEPGNPFGQIATQAAPYLILANRPAWLREKARQLVVAFWVDGYLFSPIELPFEPLLRRLTREMKLDFLEISLAIGDKQIKLQQLNPRPPSAPAEVLQALAKALAKNSKP